VEKIQVTVCTIYNFYYRKPQFVKKQQQIIICNKVADLPLASGRLTITEPLLSSSNSVQVSLPLMLQQNDTTLTIHPHHMQQYWQEAAFL